MIIAWAPQGQCSTQKVKPVPADAMYCTAWHVNSQCDSLVTPRTRSFPHPLQSLYNMSCCILDAWQACNLGARIKVERPQKYITVQKSYMAMLSKQLVTACLSCFHSKTSAKTRLEALLAFEPLSPLRPLLAKRCTGVGDSIPHHAEPHKDSVLQSFYLMHSLVTVQLS